MLGTGAGGTTAAQVATPLLWGCRAALRSCLHLETLLQPLGCSAFTGALASVTKATLEESTESLTLSAVVLMAAKSPLGTAQYRSMSKRLQQCTN